MIIVIASQFFSGQLGAYSEIYFIRLTIDKQIADVRKIILR